MDRDLLIKDHAIVNLFRPEVDRRRKIIGEELEMCLFSDEDIISMRNEADQKEAVIQGIARFYKGKIKDASGKKSFQISERIDIIRVNNIFSAAKAGIRLDDHVIDKRVSVFDVDENIPF